MHLFHASTFATRHVDAGQATGASRWRVNTQFAELRRAQSNDLLQLLLHEYDIELPAEFLTDLAQKTGVGEAG